jgi:hypothetical protein
MWPFGCGRYQALLDENCFSKIRHPEAWKKLPGFAWGWSGSESSWTASEMNHRFQQAGCLAALHFQVLIVQCDDSLALEKLSEPAITIWNAGAGLTNLGLCRVTPN